MFFDLPRPTALAFEVAAKGHGECLHAALDPVWIYPAHHCGLCHISPGATATLKLGTVTERSALTPLNADVGRQTGSHRHQGSRLTQRLISSGVISPRRVISMKMVAIFARFTVCATRIGMQDVSWAFAVVQLPIRDLGKLFCSATQSTPTTADRLWIVDSSNRPECSSMGVHAFYIRFSDASLTQQCPNQVSSWVNGQSEDRAQRDARAPSACEKLVLVFFSGEWVIPDDLQVSSDANLTEDLLALNNFFVGTGR